MAPVLFVFLLLLPSLSLSLSSPHPTLSSSDLIEKTCKNTTYYDLCVATLRSDPASSSADVKGLSVIAVNVGIANATSTSSFASALSEKAADPALKSLLKTCAGRYTDARDALRSSLAAIATESYEDASVHVRAAADYPNVCHRLFRQQPQLAYPAELATREVALEHLCTITDDIISLLLNDVSVPA